MAEIIELYSGMSIEDSKILQEIEEKNDFVSVLTEASIDAIIAFDCDFRITIFNPAAEKRSGIPKEKVMGRYYFDIFADSWRNPQIRSRLEGVLKGVGSPDKTERVRVAETEMLFRATLTPLRENGKVVGGLVVFRNVTHLHDLGQSKSETPLNNEFQRRSTT
jgi:PAS domain S-box-containing protein